MNLELISSEKIETNITINTRNRSEKMPVYIYGQFIEHLGRCIYGGIWAEMIEDRKFWYVPGTRESAWRIDGEGTPPFNGYQGSFYRCTDTCSGFGK